MILIGVSGRKRHGKDTFAARLVEHHGFTRVAFADPMRQMALALDPIISEGWRLSALVEAFGWEEAKANPEVRRTLQRLGTEAGRGVLGDGIWVDTAMRHARKLGGRVAFTDCRFPNEADAIRDAGGQVIRVNRPAFPDDGDPHPSETALDRYPFDDLVLNDGTVDDLHAIADSIAAEL